MDTATAPRVQSSRLDAIELMLRDLHTRHDEIRRGCTSELLTLQQELVDYLLSKKAVLTGVPLDRPAKSSPPNYNSFT